MGKVSVNRARLILSMDVHAAISRKRFRYCRKRDQPYLSHFQRSREIRALGAVAGHGSQQRLCERSNCQRSSPHSRIHQLTSRIRMAVVLLRPSNMSHEEERNRDDTDSMRRCKVQTRRAGKSSVKDWDVHSSSSYRYQTPCSNIQMRHGCLIRMFETRRSFSVHRGTAFRESRIRLVSSPDLARPST